MKSIITAVAVAGLMVAGNAMAADAAFDLGKCNACHKTGVGPAYKDIAAAYGKADALAAVMKGGLKVEERKVAAGNDKWKKAAATMTGQVGLFKGKEDAAAAAVFAAK